MPARGGCDKKEGFVPPCAPGRDPTTRGVKARHEARGAKLAARRAGRRRVPIESGSARRYVHAYRGLVNKPPGRTHGQPHVVRGLVKVDLSAPDVTGPRVFWVWIAQPSQRKVRGT